MQLNTDARIRQEMMRNYKRLLVLAKGTQADVDKINSASHDTTHLISGITKDDINGVEIGGVTEQALAHEQISKENLESTLGLNDFSVGKVAGVGLATEQNYAHEGAMVRFSGIKQAFDDGVKDLLWRAFWFIYEDNRYAAEMGPDASQELVKRGLAEMQTSELPDGTSEERLPDATYLGGERQGVKRLPWNALSIDIQPYSMERTSEARAQQQGVQMLAIVAQLVPLAAMNPTFPWADFAEKLGEMSNFPGVGELFGKPEEIAAGTAQMAQLMAGGQQGGSGPQPKVASVPSSGGRSRPQQNAKPVQQRGPAGSRKPGKRPEKMGAK